MENYTEIGVITKPQGLAGEVRITVYSDDVTRFLSYKYLYIGQEKEKRKIIKSRILQNNVVCVQLQDIDTIEKAEILRNIIVYIDNTQLPQLNENEYFVKDLIGCELSTEQGKTLGIVVDVDCYGSVNVISFKNEEGKILQFPFLNRVIKTIDIDNRKFVVFEKEFSEVVIDEN